MELSGVAIAPADVIDNVIIDISSSSLQDT